MCSESTMMPKCNHCRLMREALTIRGEGSQASKGRRRQNQILFIHKKSRAGPARRGQLENRHQKEDRPKINVFLKELCICNSKELGRQERTLELRFLLMLRSNKVTDWDLSCYSVP